MLIQSVYLHREKKVHKRASNVLKLTQENEKLQAQLKAMAEQLEAMERMRAQLVAKEQKAVEKKS
jgi:outer membrane murein-binding lipoprotein Lpp